MTESANTCVRVSAKPRSKNAEIALPRGLMNMIHGYGIRSLRYPITICPNIPKELNRARTIAALNKDRITGTGEPSTEVVARSDKVS